MAASPTKAFQRAADDLTAAHTEYFRHINTFRQGSRLAPIINDMLTQLRNYNPATATPAETSAIETMVQVVAGWAGNYSLDADSQSGPVPHSP